MKCVLLLAVVVFASSSWARRIEGVDFAEQATVAGKTLVLNGVGLRTKRILGINFRVYVAGLYLAKKTTDAAEILNSKDTRYLNMVFLRSLSAGTLRGAWEEAFDQTCSDCASEKAPLKKFNELMTGVEDKSRMTLTFTPEAVELEIHVGNKSVNGKIEGATFSKDLLAVFIGAHPPGVEFKNGLLGKK